MSYSATAGLGTIAFGGMGAVMDLACATAITEYRFVGKSPAEHRAFGVDFKLVLNGDSIASYAVLCDNNDGALIIGAPSVSGTILSASIAGGTAGISYRIRYKIITALAAVVERTVLLPCAAL